MARRARDDDAGQRTVSIVRLGPGDETRVVAASHLFDGPVDVDGARRFLASPGHHLLVAQVENTDVGFVSGVETTHPDKGTEMFLYELGVAKRHRRRGIGRALVDALAALATYAAAGADGPDPGVTLTWTFR